MLIMIINLERSNTSVCRDFHVFRFPIPCVLRTLLVTFMLHTYYINGYDIAVVQQ